jgi:NitT/TauT family transport system ATP-binding protein
MSYLELQNLTKTFRDPQRNELIVLHNISLTIQQGEFICLVGPSGCGKSTLLRLIDGLLQPDQGRIIINGEVVTQPGPDRGVVFQHGNLLPWRTALGNVEYGLEMRGVPKAERRDKAMHYIDLVGLHGFEKYFPAQLSGGMQHRTGLARALAIEPEILLMDEPLASLDAQTRETLQVELARICSNISRTVIFVTHDIEEAIFLADRVVVMSSNPGSIAQITTIPFEQPRLEALRSMAAFATMRGEIAQLLRPDRTDLG